MPAAVLSTFPQFFHRHLNITFMEFCLHTHTHTHTHTHKLAPHTHTLAPHSDLLRFIPGSPEVLEDPQTQEQSVLFRSEKGISQTYTSDTTVHSKLHPLTTML